MSMKTPSRTKLNESGLVSIVVTMIIMVLLSLIVLGFARVSRREQRQGLDRQLASQAQYAAETGINDAVHYLKSGGLLSASASTDCNTYRETGAVENTINQNVVYSCVLVDNTVRNLVYDQVGTDSEVVFPIRPASPPPGGVSSIQVSWQNNSEEPVDGSTCPGGASLPPQAGAGAWACPLGALRIDIVPTDNLSRDTFVSDVRSTLLRPRFNNTAAPGAVWNDHGTIQQVNCSTGRAPRTCVARLALSIPADSYYVKIRPVYREADIHIIAGPGPTEGLNGPADGISLIGTQAVIDSTGRANDVLKRLLVRVPSCPEGDVCGKRPAGFALQTAESLCKLYGIIPPNRIEQGNTDPACAIQ